MFFVFDVDNYPYIRRKNELLFGIISELTDNIEFQTYFKVLVNICVGIAL